MPKRLIAIALVAIVSLGVVAGFTALRLPAAPSAPIATLSIRQPAQPEEATVHGVEVRNFQIQANRSSARFTIDEILAGSLNTVVGTTNQVSGQIAVDSMGPSNAQIGTVLINARTLTTDDAQRNRIINNLILSTSQYEFIAFSPTAIRGLPETATLGSPYSLQIDGDLTIRDVSRPVSFAATVTPVSDTELQGSATTTVRYADWGINIPQVPRIAGVDDNVKLQLDFVATS